MKASIVGYELRCMLFPTSLIGPAKNWFEKYKRHSISSWDQLSRDFKKQFRAMIGIRLEVSALTNVRQQPNETLKSYLTRFNLEVAQARDVDDSGHLMAVRAGVMPGSPLWEDMQRKPVRSLTKFNRQAQRFVNVEEARSALNMASHIVTTTTNINSASTSADPTASKPPVDNPSKRKKNEGNNPEAEGGKKKKEERYFFVYKVYSELNESWENIYLDNENQVPFRCPDPMRNQKAKKDSSKYCRFHRDIRHTTDECRQLKGEIEGLISRGYFRQYVIKNQNPNHASTSQRAAAAPPAQNSNSRTREDKQPPPIDGEDVVTVSGGPHIVGSGMS
ncbi:uncharacterized protein LOC133798592 [Humulus lupulus]|uniref:uncharacterized protein LOC133798592 n=1 Tax=Humulus lupulus TaxID=3486 RepID=UPI002B40D1E3|nr:uncharacterized protein LOC133798592 [Humulus lupulus]XP_062092950.1 uncharacterized protein LOC133798592 [Humulus lupulus]XP_062092951.1 uncharacterized protein LOC133798592 [Humulus lupulus]XP_062092952.1 uncharacterized protein LOC133798592 [Humulus lupulus]XP_062092953.1 uncharacterized protein LOC133798592 [Humulus lupulus]XP_062092954.1 uncharacterized protein LOC133798592 [Humulus lupulus]XP_062092955.1 uncharacterized protein LOC133798592 [Humulus lupulus]XP_062092956.1 uncharacte